MERVKPVIEHAIPNIDGAEVVNRLADRVRAKFLRRIELGDCLFHASPDRSLLKGADFMISIKSLGLTEANLVIQAGIARANEIGSPSTIAVVDVGGTIVAQARMDGASLSSVALAYNKAYTSLSVG